MSVLRDSIVHGILHITKQLRMGSKMRNIAKVEQDTIEMGDKESEMKMLGSNIEFGADAIRMTGQRTIIDTNTLKLNSAGLMYGTKDPDDVDFGTTDIPDGTIYFKLL